jgi:hypothetical protein
MYQDGRMTAATFRILKDGPLRLPPISTAEIEANLDKVRQHPGEWCVVATFGSKSSASNRAGRMRDDHPDLEIRSRGCEMIARTTKDP